jgi:uncharacterized protein YggT (Ycf19 family)
MRGLVVLLINIVLAVIEFLLSLRFIFLFFGASAASSFVGWIYGASVSLVIPFSGIIPNLKLGSFLVDSSTLMALIVYTVIGKIVVNLLRD